MTKEQLGKLIIASTDSLYRISKSILHNDTDCEDAVSEAITISFQKIDTLKHDEYAKTWLTKILINECYKLLRKRQFIAEDIQIEAQAENQHENYSELYKALMSLDARYRIPIELYYIEGYKIREIAQILNFSENTIKTQLARGRNILKNQLEQEVIG